MESLRNEEQRRILMRFFKTGPGEYGYGDEFLGLKVPQTREVVKAVGKDFPLEEVPELLMSKWHEVRLCGLLILVEKFEKLSPLPTSPRGGVIKRRKKDAEAIKKRDEILTLYLKYAERANNWDLVDLSAPKILGGWLAAPLLSPLKGGGQSQDLEYKRQVLDELAASDNLWKQRMSIVCTWMTSRMGDPSWCLRYAEIHLHHPHDLMHKAVGWMLREMGKAAIKREESDARINSSEREQARPKVKGAGMDLLREFLRQHAHEMPRTMLRYAIEKMDDEERKHWMAVDGGRKKADARCSKTKMSPFAGIPVSDFVDIILHDAKRSDKAMCYLLHQRLNRQLRERYDAYQLQLYDSYEDVVEDFFLYLREGRGSRFPYQALKRIKNNDAFEKWLLTTFRNYLEQTEPPANGLNN